MLLGDKKIMFNATGGIKNLIITLQSYLEWLSWY